MTHDLLDLDFSHYHEEVTPAQADSTEACVVSLFGAAARSAIFAGFDMAADALLVRAAGGRGNEAIALGAVRYVWFERLVDIRVAEDHFFCRDVKFDAVGKPKPFTLSFREGQPLVGKSYGYCFSALGLGLYMADAGGLARRCLAPRKGIVEFSVGEPLGQLLLGRNQLSEDGLQRALAAQRALRAQRVGEILSEKRVVDPESLDAALQAQADMPARKIGQVMLEMGVISEAQLHDALAEQQHRHAKQLGEILIEMGLLDREAVKEALAEKLGVPHVDLARFAIEPEAVKLIPHALILKLLALPIYRVSNGLVVAMQNPFDHQAISTLRFTTQMRIIPVLATADEIKGALRNKTPNAAIPWELER